MTAACHLPATYAERALTVSRARELRANATWAEALLWGKLRQKRLEGVRFRRQHPIGRFIVDFYAPSLKLVVEIDGPVHQQQQAYDQRRQAALEAQGVRFLRFGADEVEQETEACLEKISAWIVAQRGPRSERG